MSVFKVMLALPSTHIIEADFAWSVTALTMAMAKHRVPGYDNNGLEIANRRSSLLPSGRHGLVKDALAKGCSHVAFIDSDQTFPASLLHRLARHGKRVIGCNVATKRQEGSYPTARAKPKDESEWFAGHMVYSKGKTGLEQVWRLGFGIMLIDLEVFQKLPKPWFNLEYVPKIDDYLGEDWWFCRLCEEHNIPIWVDHDVSQEIGHIGPWIFTHDGCEPEPTQAQLKEVA